MNFKKAIAALLKDQPDNVDWSLFDSSIASVKAYYDEYGQLPSWEYMQGVLGLPIADAPWQVYEKQLRDDKFVVQAAAPLTLFNNTYDLNPQAAILKLRDDLASLSEPHAIDDFISILTDRSRFDKFKQRRDKFLKTGLPPFDEQAGGGIDMLDEFMIILARTNVGKSWVAEFIATHIAKTGHRVGYYSGEMSPENVGGRFDSIISHIPNLALTRGKDIEGMPAHFTVMDGVIDRGGEFEVITPQRLRRYARPSDVRRWFLDKEFDIVFLDQADYMLPDGWRPSMTKHEKDTLLSMQLNELRSVLQKPIVLVVQANREGAKEELDVYHIANADQYGRDATTVLALTRKPDSTLEIKVCKARGFGRNEDPWIFDWNIDVGILSFRANAASSVRERINAIRATETVSTPPQNQDPVEII